MEHDTAELKAKAAAHLWMAYQPPEPYAAEGGPPVLVTAEGSWMVDSDGNRYLDGVSALEACIAGHGREELTGAAYQQMQRLEFLDVFRYASPPAIELAARLAEITPGSLSRVHFTPGGSEAVETAIKVAQQYHHFRGESGRFKVITREGAYHGCTFGAMAVDGGYFGSRVDLFELPAFGRVAPAPYHYRCRHCSQEPSCSMACAEELEELILAEGPETVSAVIMDPCATASAVSIPPPEYMPRVAEICRRYEVLLILDEVITGFGRTGRMFAAEHWDLQPDIMTLSKGLSSGYVPIGATVVAEEVADVFRGSPEGVLWHGQTYGGHPVACAVALANLDLIEAEDLVGHAAKKGARLLEGLQSLSYRAAYGEARGLGLLCGLEFVHDQTSRRLPEDPKQAGYRMRGICRELGLITLTLHPGNVLFLAPPLNIPDEDLDQMLEMVDRALGVYEERYL
jgi:taurine-pyruvate aminotransferase